MKSVHGTVVPDSGVPVFERSGHTPQVEEAATFDNLVLDWLRPGDGIASGSP